MESGDILDNQITASSHRPGELPQYGRLNNNKYWCAGKKSKDEYFQVDLGQVSWKIGSCSLQLKQANFDILKQTLARGSEE